MRLLNVSERHEEGGHFTLWPLGDIHLGSANCDKGHLFRAIDAINRDPNARWIGIGDYCEWIGVRDKRWHAGGIDESIISLADIDCIGDAYVDRIGALLSPISDKCWAIGDGNHEQKFSEEHHTALVPRIMQASGIPSDRYTGWAAITRVAFQDQHEHRSSIRIFHSHGWQAGRMDGAKVNQLDHIMGWIDGCRIYLQGHSHSRLVKTKTKLHTNASCTKLVAYDAYGAHTGSYLRTYEQGATGYGEAKGYPPTSLGTIRFVIRPTREGVEVEAVH